MLAKLTLEEKTALMAGGSAFATAAVPRLGIASINVSDGPNGVGPTMTSPRRCSRRARPWRQPGILRCFRPWAKPSVARRSRCMCRSCSGPTSTFNVGRSPAATSRDYSEDPFLTGTLGTAYVRGVQSQGVGTSVKHFVANEQELRRLTSSSNVDERTLREIYLLPFEMIVKSAEPWTVMASYNRLNGTYMSENRAALARSAAGRVGLPGLGGVGLGAVHSTAPAASSGMNLEMPGPPRFFGAPLANAVRNHEVSQDAIDDAVRRVLGLLARAGALDHRPRASGEL